METATSWPVFIGLTMGGLSLLLVLMRLLIGPTLADRVVALDMISYLAIGLIALWTIASGVPAYLDAALVLALIAFLATVAFAQFLERPNRLD